MFNKVIVAFSIFCILYGAIIYLNVYLFNSFYYDIADKFQQLINETKTI